jgi:hypothetical protein
MLGAETTDFGTKGVKHEGTVLMWETTSARTTRVVGTEADEVDGERGELKAMGLPIYCKVG